MEDTRYNTIPIILIGTSFTGIAISLLFPVAYNLILLIFCILLLISTRNLTKNLIVNKSESLFWIPTLAIGIFSLISLLTPESYNTLVIQIPYIDDLHWLWQFQVWSEQVQIIALFYIPSILASGVIIVYISFKIKNDNRWLTKNPWILRIVANVLIIFPLILYNGKLFNFGVSYIVITPGFAIFGPIFCGFMLKDQMKLPQKGLELSFTKYERKRNKLGFGSTITAGLIFLLVGCNIDNFDEMMLSVISPLIPTAVAIFLFFYYKILLLVIGTSMLVLPFLSGSYPRFVVILLLIARRIIILHSFPIMVILIPIFLKVLFLILYIPAKIIFIDSIRTFNLLKLEKKYSFL